MITAQVEQQIGPIADIFLGVRARLTIIADVLVGRQHDVDGQLRQRVDEDVPVPLQHAPLFLRDLACGQQRLPEHCQAIDRQRPIRAATVGG